MGVILGSAVAVLWGTGDLFAALAARRFGSIRTLAIAQSTELALCVGLWVLFPSLLNSAPVPIAPLLFIGVLTAVSYGALYQGLMLGPVMIVAPIAGAYAVGPVVLAVAFLDEQLSMTQRFGVTAAIAGVVAVTAGERKAGSIERSAGRIGVAFGLIAMVGFAASAFMLAAYAQRTGWFAPLLISRAGVALVLAFVAVCPRSRKLKTDVPTPATDATTRWSVYLAILVGICNLIGTALYARSGQLGLIAVVSAVSASFPLVPIVAGFVLLHERLRWMQIVGIAMIIGGLVVLA